MNKIITLLLIMFVSTSYGQSQFTQTIRGRIIDKDSKLPLPGANVLLINSTPVLGTVSDPDGNFRLTKIPVGRQGIQITFLGYKPATIQNLIVGSAKEIVLDIELEESVSQVEEVTVRAYGRKDQALNKMAAVSARAFTVEETEKYAGSRGDIARMAMNYAGVSSANDQRNDIVIRGNSPSGLLWRLEDVEIPNPNHFAENGTTGGPVGMLNNNLLQNSDFITSAFPAEYGNAMSGVFDLNMRNGNNEKHEFLFQSGFNGFELGAEGPINKATKSSYLANFRYSTLELMDGIIDIGTSGIPKYKDFSYKVNFPMKKGKISLFGIGGWSEIAMLDSKENKQDMYTDDNQDLYNRSKMAATGISYMHFAGERTYYKISASGLYTNGGTIIDSLDVNNQPHLNIDHNYEQFTLSVSGFVHTKYSSKLSTKTGLSIDRMGFDLNTSRFKMADMGMRPVIQYKRGLNNGVTLYRTYYQASYKFNDQFSINPGLHFIFFDLNNSWNLEPRISASWQPTKRQRFNIGYGYHSRIQNLATYFYGSFMPNRTLVETNKNLDLTKSHQFVMGYDLSISENTRIKVEAYYQYLFNVPVELRTTSFSLLNTGAGWGPNTEDSLVNKGTGRNYGLEFTLERFFSKGFYYLSTLSLFESKYTGSDNIERNTAFNGNYVWNLLLGKEFKLSARSTITLDYKLTFAGGKRYTPIDIEASKKTDDTEYIESRAYEKQFSPFFKTDIKVGYRLNGRRVSHEWQFYVENFTGHKNILMQSYNSSEERIKNTYQLGVFPMILYRLHF
ncbi:MAG TPA: TonB-dependent receptor [Bacteroidales bacterium]|nr:TonB-dependent receptor [Bacteroidales bacterium]